MENKRNTAETKERGDTKYSNHCIACLEPIRSGARVCPHCGSNQAGNRWTILGNILKWVGGITAIISLIAASVQVNELYLDWRQKGVVIEELVRAAQFQQEASDYSNAWEFLDQALLLEPTSRIARQQQVNLAMVWVKHINLGNEQFIETIDKLIPVLYRGVASVDQHNAAMVSAHLGWAELQRRRWGVEGIDIERHFKRSLRLDPDNLYGNVMYGYWLLTPQNLDKPSKKSAEQAAKHFQTALNLGGQKEYVRSLQMEAYLYSFSIDANIKAYETALLLINNGETFSQSDRARIAINFASMIRNKAGNSPNIYEVQLYDTLIDILGPDQLLRVFNWAYPAIKDPGETTRLYVQSRLIEASGDEKAAINLYREMISKFPSSYYSDSTYAREHIRQIELKMNICYMPMVVVESLRSDAQTTLKALQREDILLSYNGVNIHNYDELNKAKELVDINHDVKLVIIRDATPFILEVKAGKLGINFIERQVSERALSEYANIMCSKEQVPQIE